MIDKTQLICIVCPNGCMLDIERSNEDIINVNGALCDKGKTYAKNELLNPVRNLTTTVKVKDGELPLVSVRSEREIPRDKIFEAIKLLKGLEVQAPVGFHQIIARDIAGSGVDIIATREVKRSGK